MDATTPADAQHNPEESGAARRGLAESSAGLSDAGVHGETTTHTPGTAQTGSADPAEERPSLFGVNPDGTPRTMLDQMGGWQGLVISSLPVLVLVPVNQYFGLIPAIAAALGVSVLTGIYSVVRTHNVQPAISGVVGVAIAGGIAWYVGSAKGYFLYGMWYSAVMGAIFVLSCLVRWPLVGVIVAGLRGKPQTWHRVRPAVYTYDIATLFWAVVFFARFFIQNHFYAHDATGSLAVARIALGWPLTILAGAITLWAYKRVRRILPDEDDH